MTLVPVNNKEVLYEAKVQRMPGMWASCEKLRDLRCMQRRERVNMIKVTEKYGISVDDMNCTVVNLAAPKTEKTGKISYKAIAFYSSLPGALRKILQLEQARGLSDHDMELREALQIVQECCRRFETVLERAEG